jgi:hypothetical protein
MRLTQNLTLRELTESCAAERLGIDNTPLERLVGRLRCERNCVLAL